MPEEKKAKKEEQPKKQDSPKTEKLIVALRIRGNVGVNQDIEATLKMLNLKEKHNCAVLKQSAPVMGMLRRAKDYITWGEIDSDVHKELTEKRTKKMVNKKGETVAKPFFRLHPPRGGFEKGGIKKPFAAGGALGYRGAKINDLIKKMI